VIGVIAVGIGCWFGRPLVPFLKATQEGVSLEQAALLVSSLEQSPEFGSRLAAASVLLLQRKSDIYEMKKYDMHLVS